MTDSQFLYGLMMRTNEARAKHPRAFMWALMEEVTEAEREREEGRSIDRYRDELLDIAAVCLRLAVETTDAEFNKPKA